MPNIEIFLAQHVCLGKGHIYQVAFHFREHMAMSRFVATSAWELPRPCAAHRRATQRRCRPCAERINWVFHGFGRTSRKGACIFSNLLAIQLILLHTASWEPGNPIHRKFRESWGLDAVVSLAKAGIEPVLARRLALCRFCCRRWRSTGALDWQRAGRSEPRNLAGRKHFSFPEMFLDFR